MIAANEQASPTRPPVAVVDIGNTSVSAGLWTGERVLRAESMEVARIEELGALLRSYGDTMEGGLLPGVAIASVVPAVLQRLSTWVEDHLNLEPLVVGQQIALPIEVGLDAPHAVGTDRICAAAAAFDRNKQACAVVDCGSAVTVDMVDDEGSFLGGAIFPGLRMQAKALHEHTALLPEVVPIQPGEVIGTSTERAIQTGIFHGTSGAIRGIVEAYATHLSRWPIVVGTGGDIALMARECDIFDAIVPDLCLIGVGLAYDRRLGQAVSL